MYTYHTHTNEQNCTVNSKQPIHENYNMNNSTMEYNNSGIKEQINWNKIRKNQQQHN